MIRHGLLAAGFVWLSIQENASIVVRAMIRTNNLLRRNSFPLCVWPKRVTCLMWLDLLKGVLEHALKKEE